MGLLVPGRRAAFEIRTFCWSANSVTNENSPKSAGAVLCIAICDHIAFASRSPGAGERLEKWSPSANLQVDYGGHRNVIYSSRRRLQVTLEPPTGVKGDLRFLAGTRWVQLP
jgi:hypothetical protein